MGDGVTEAEFSVLEEESSLELRRYWWTVRKHLSLVLAVPLALSALAILHDLMATRRYTAEATVLIQTNAPRIFDSQVGSDPNSASMEDPSVFQNTEYELLKSRSLAVKVIEAENLANNPFFAAKKRGKGGLLDQLRSALPSFGQGSSGTSKQPEGRSSTSASEALVPAYLGSLKVRPVEDTELAKIAFTTPDPSLSARLANAHVREFVHQRIELNAQTSEEAARFLQQKLVELKRQVEESELALNNYRRDKDIIPGLISMNGKQDVVLERLNSLSQELQEEHLKTVALGAQVALIDEGRVNVLPAVVESQLIQKLKGELDGLEAQYTGMASELKPDYPPMHELQSKIDRTEELLHQEVSGVAGSVRAEYSAALRKEKSLQDELDRQKKFALGLNDAAVRYVILEREADTNRQLYNAVLKRMKDVSIVAGAHTSNASLVDPAVPPTAPSSPRSTRNVLFSIALGLMIGLGLAFGIERLDNTLTSTSDAQRFLHVPTLGAIPESRVLTATHGPAATLKLGRNGSTSGQEVGSYGGYSQTHEAYLSLRATLLLSRAGTPPKSIVITSANPGEGKTVTAINTAAVLAHTGSRVLLIDGDLRRPKCHKRLSIRNHCGLTEVLAGVRELDGIVHGTQFPGLYLLSAGKIPPNPAELLASERMKTLLGELTTQYDFLVIDTPPLLPVSDAMVLGAIVDGVVMVVDSSTTPKQQVKEAIGRLEHARTKIFGTVLNKVKANIFGYDYYGLQSYYLSGYESDDDHADDAIDLNGHA